MKNSNNDYKLTEPKNIKAFKILFLILIILFICAMSNKTPTPSSFNDYKALDIKNININCNHLINHKDEIESKKWIKETENIHSFEYNNKYKFDQCKELINIKKAKRCTNLIAVLSEFIYSRTIHTVTWSDKNQDKGYCLSEWNDYVGNLKFAININKNKIMDLYLPNYDVFINRNTIQKIVKRKAIYGDYWIISIFLHNEEYAYRLLYGMESDADKTLDLINVKSNF
jgi:hypothetical protein